MNNQLDIIIPVYNRSETLRKTLRHISWQEISPAWQVRIIIVDDGSTEDIAHIVKDEAAPFPIELIRQRHAGIAAARNRGLQAATGHIILFLGADILLQVGALQEHIRFHEQYPQANLAALGGIKWDPTINPSAIMEWMIHGGPQNDIDNLLGLQQVDPQHFFYGSHISLKKSFLPKQLFSPAYQGYGWEDLAAGRNLAKQGLKLYVLHQAIGLHHHTYGWSAICQRQYEVGQNYNLFSQQYRGSYPGLTARRRLKIKLFFGSGLYAVLWGVLSMTSHQLTTPRLFQLVTAAQFWRGVLKGEKKAKNATIGHFRTLLL